MRKTIKVHINNPENFKIKLAHWSTQFSEISWMDSNCYEQNHSNFEAILAVEAFTALKTDHSKAFDQLHEYQQVTQDWIFGYLSYDLKNDVEELSSSNFDGLDFPELYFFQPKKIFILKGNELEMQYLKLVEDEMESDFEEILGLLKKGELKDKSGNISDGSGELKVERGEAFEKSSEGKSSEGKSSREWKVESGKASEGNGKLKVACGALEKGQIMSRISKDQYIQKVKEMLVRINKGDIYEANFCQEFYANGLEIDPLQIFSNLNKISVPPFAVFLRLGDHYLLCASPERYLKKTGSQIISQPIKGTARRSENADEDTKIAENLARDPKERSENVMIVDLVRNDLSKVATKGSVKVEELCKVYSFEQVHQMISTVSAELEEGIPPVEVLRATFPMGSMTGAPKISAMKIIEQLEETKRGLYSGAVGYFSPEGDFDFNVVIRSILYNAENNYVSFSVGGAITARSQPEKEYEECLLKSEAMRKVLTSNI